MEKFKVICKATGNDWLRNNGMKTIIKKRFLGLIKKIYIGEDTEKTYGPTKDEICIVLDVREDGYYKLAGYVHNGWYTPDPFIRLDEFEETQKEIAKKTEPALN